MATQTQEFLGTGRRKTSVARVRLAVGSGKITVNGRAFETYFPTDTLRSAATAPLQRTEMLTRYDVAYYALDVHRPTPAIDRQLPASDGPLSRRELEVAELVADGASNAQVAARLFISERTVESHVANIFNKLGVDTRLQVARWFASTQVIAPN